MGEEKWTEYQQQRKQAKAKLWRAKNCDKVIEHRRRLKKKLVEYKGGKCEDCGFDMAYMSCYDFHHRDPDQKDFQIGGSTKSLEKLKAEVDKCQLLCKMCHAIVHEKLYDEQRAKTREAYLDILGSPNGMAADC